MTQPGPLQNWSGTVTFSARRLHRPESLEQLQQLVAGSDRVHALGSAHSFSRVADTDGDLVSVAGLPASMQLAGDQRTVTVAAGVRYGELASWLHARGLALHNLGSLPHLSVAGAVATATHGSGDRHGNLATAVTGLELVTADGSLTRLDLATDADQLRGAVVGLGGLGVITAVTLAVEPSYDVTQQVFEDLPLGALDDRFDQVMAAGDSVSLFTDWRAPRFTQVWVKQRADADDPESGARAAAELLAGLGAHPAAGARNPVAGMAVENATAQGVPGPWHERWPHFRLEFTPSSGAEIQSEYLLPRSAAVEALHAVAALADTVAPVLLVCEVRTVAADELWLSPSYRRETVGLHFTWAKDPAGVQAALAVLEPALLRFDPRPHWGKVFALPPQIVRAGYPRRADFAALARRLDPLAKFATPFLQAYVL